MASRLNGLDRATAIAMVASGLMIAQMVAAKTLRDSIFLSSFHASALPLMTFVAAAIAIAASFAGSQIASRVSPGILVPGAFLLSGVLQVGEYLLYAENVQAAAVVIFLHVFALNLLLTSAFWSLMTEHFDPHSAQKAFGRIAGMGTLGGILGGLLAERTAALGSVPMLILFAAGLHFACALAMWIFTSKYPAAPARGQATQPALAESLRRSPYLVQLALLVVTVSVAAGVLDFLLKSQATLSIGKGPELARFFAWFYTATSVVGVAVQTLTTPAILSRLGPAIPVRSLPAAIVLGGGGLLLSFGFAGLTLLRGLEVVLRGSMFRSGYEMFYTPVAAAEKRAVKGIIDVTGERLGDLLGSGLIGLLLWLSAGQSSMLLAAVVCAGIALLLARRLEDSYLKALEKSLARQSCPLKAAEDNPLSGISFVAGSDLMTGLPGHDADQLEVLMQPAFRQLIELRSADEGRIKNALLKMEKVDPLICGQLIQLLASTNCAFLAMEKLKAVSSQHAGQLADSLLDLREKDMIRRRVPLVMAASKSQLALDALTAALKDPGFQIRFRSAYAMRQIKRECPGLELQVERVWSALASELQIDRAEWEERRMGKGQEKPGDASVEYVFLLLRLLLPPEPVEMAYRALGTEDRHLRGTALEYLQTALPSATWKQIEGLIADHLVKPKGAASQA